jgi:hypothetical protein
MVLFKLFVCRDADGIGEFGVFHQLLVVEVVVPNYCLEAANLQVLLRMP